MSQYHPKNVNSVKEQNATYLKSRVEGFLYLLESGCLDDVSLLQDNADDIIKLMDTGEVKVHALDSEVATTVCCTAVIKMEGGTEHDLLSLGASASGENGDKQQEGGSDKQDKKKDSEF